MLIMQKKTHIVHGDFVAAMTRAEFLSAVKKGDFQIIREVHCEDLTLINVYIRFKGTGWAIQQGDSAHIYETPVFWARINALADAAAAKFAVDIRRAINTDYQRRTIGPCRSGKSSVRVLHADDGRAAA